MRKPSQRSSFLDQLRRGNAAYRAARHPEAVRAYREAVALDPASAPARSNLGRALVKVGRLDEAMAELEHALRINPGHSPSMYYLALCLDQMGLTQRAIPAYQRFLQSSAGAPPGYAEKAGNRLRELKRPRSEASRDKSLGKPPSLGSKDVESPAIGALFPGERHWSPGQVVDGIYRVEEGLGKGGFGEVHRVEHLGWHLQMAVKSPHGHLLSNPGAMKRFVQEANTLVGLGLHPNITTFYFVRLIEGVPRIFMEYLKAGNFRDWLDKRKITDAKTALDVAIQLARAMERVQYRGLVHRDLKPENCLMTPEGVLKVTDFGLAKTGLPEAAPEGRPAPEPESDAAGASRLYRLGTREYMAPEQWLQADKATSSADVWAFGVIVWEMLHGAKPFQWLDEPDEAFYQRMKERRWGYDFRPDAPAELRSIVSACLMEDPARRESKFSVLRERLEALYASYVGKPYPRPPVKQTPPLADTLSNQGVSMMDLGRDEDALRLFTAALRQDPTHPGATYNQGILLMKKGEIAPDELAARLEGCKQARPWEWAPEYLRRLVQLRDKDQGTAIKALREAKRVWDDPLVTRALAFAEAGRHTAALEPFVSPPTGTEAAMADEARFYALLAQARTEADSGQALKAYGTLLTAREVKGYARAPLALSLQARLGCHGKRQTLKAGWLRHSFTDSGGCLCAAISPGGDQGLSGHEDGMLRLWELETGRSLKTMGRRLGPLKGVCFLPDMTAALAGGKDGTVTVWDLVSGECVRTFEGHPGGVTAVRGLPNGKQALSAGEDGALALWNLEDGSLQQSFKAHKGGVKSVRLGAVGARAVSVGADGLLAQWDLRKGRGLCAPIDVGSAHALALSAEGRFALVAGNGRLSEWDLITRARTREARLKNQGSPLWAVDATADGNFLIAGGDDRIARLWDRSGQGTSLPVAWSFEGHRKAISHVEFSANARWALSGGRDGLRLWELDWEFVFP